MYECRMLSVSENKNKKTKISQKLYVFQVISQMKIADLDCRDVRTLATTICFSVKGYLL